jgi:branched-chain amino acid transport system ATP-binding protein
MLMVRNLYVNRRAIPVLKGVNLSVASGEIVALLGANGAGKSTLACTISGQVRPESGEILWNGIRLDGSSPQRIVSQGVVHCPEGRQLFGSLTVEENLRLAGSRPGIHWKDCQSRLPRYIDLFPIIRDRWTQQAGSLSGGEQQMVALVRAFIVAPQLLIIDEVSLGLAPTLIDRIFHILPDMLTEGMAVLLIEQQARSALRIAHRAYLLAQGSIVFEGSADSVRRKLEAGAGYFHQV